MYVTIQELLMSLWSLYVVHCTLFRSAHALEEYFLSLATQLRNWLVIFTRKQLAVIMRLFVLKIKTYSCTAII